MFIKAIEIQKNPIYGDIKFDFCDSNGLPYNNIILAGENGSGKSTLLNIIYDFFSNPVPNKNSEEKRIFTVLLTNIEWDIFKSSVSGVRISSDFKNELIITIDYTKAINNWNSINVLVPSNNGSNSLNFGGYVLANQPIRNIFKSIFSDVEVNYTPNQINSTSSLDLDRITRPTEKSSNNLATQITQLLIDISSLDDSEYASWGRRHPGQKNEENKNGQRLDRFKNAFDYIFTDKHFSRVENTNEGKKVIFEEFGKEISLDRFSSGEKQIIFRGSFLLKDKVATWGAVIIIDEPEISLHPKWQLKILQFYKRLFFNEEGEQTSQIFFATHSPFVIHNDNSDIDKIIVLEKNENGSFIQKEPTFYGWTPESAILEAFDITLDFSENKTIVLVEGPTDEKYIKKALDIFEENDLNILIQWIGREDSKGNKATGESSLKAAKEYLISNSNLYRNKFVLLFDSDVNIDEEEIESANLCIMKQPINDGNTLYKKGIENLLCLPPNFPKDNFYDTHKTIDPYGAKKDNQSFNKKRLCNWICDELETIDQRYYLNKLQSCIKKIEQFAEKENEYSSMG